MLLVFLTALPWSGEARAAVPATPDMPVVLGPQRTDYVLSELVADQQTARPGQTLRIGLKLVHDAGWHTYWRNPGDSGLPTLFEPSGPAGSQFGDIVWPMPERLAIGPLANYGYEGEVLLAREVRLPADLRGPARFEVHAQWLVCREVCIPGEARLGLELPLAAGADQTAPVWSSQQPLFEQAAERAPQGPALQARAQIEAGRLALALPVGLKAARAEFFPYFEALVTPAADQRLLAADAADGSQRLELTVAGDAPGLETIAEDLRGGLLVADGRPLALQLIPVNALPRAGQLISVAEVRQPSAGAGAGQSSAPGSGSLLSAVRSMTGTAAPSASAAGGGAVTAQASPGDTAAPAATTGKALTVLAMAVGGALLGGLLLNLMPCVFPVIGLKVLSFANQDTAPATRRQHALAFAAGVILSLVLLGGLLLVLRGLGQSVGWGFQLQSPVFVAAMSLLFVLIALNLFGVFEIGASLTTIESKGSGSWGHFWAGAVAVLVATPCTAPFMGGAIGFTLGAGSLETMAVFIALGVGMAAPYVLFGLFPALLRWLPRPGPWLEGLRQLLGFPMLATAIWLAWVLMLQTGADGGLRLLMAALLAGFAAWLYGRRQRRGSSSRRGWFSHAAQLALVLGVLAAGWQLRAIAQLGAAELSAASQRGTASGSAGAAIAGVNAAGQVTPSVAGRLDWQPWSNEAVAAARRDGRPVFVDFTAAWCISCQANKKLVLERDVIRDAFVAAGVVALRADWTRADPAITAELARHGRNGVPLYLYYPAGGTADPQILPELLTPETVISALAAGAPVSWLSR